jgi:hypothetical protein
MCSSSCESTHGRRRMQTHGGLQPPASVYAPLVHSSLIMECQSPRRVITLITQPLAHIFPVFVGVQCPIGICLHPTAIGTSSTCVRYYCGQKRLSPHNLHFSHLLCVEGDLSAQGNGKFRSPYGILQRHPNFALFGLRLGIPSEAECQAPQGRIDRFRRLKSGFCTQMDSQG